MPGANSIRSALCFESDSEASSQMVSYMQGVGISVTVCQKTADAISVALVADHDAFLVSSVIDGRLGFPIARALRAHPALYKIPVAICSHESDARSRFQALSQFADAYLIKPVTAPALGDCLTQLQRLAADLAHVCPITNLPSSSEFLRYVDHRLLRGEIFALLSVRVIAPKLKDQSKARAAVQSGVQKLFNIVQKLIESHGFYEVRMAHRGGWLVIMLRQGDELRFAGALQRRLAALAPPHECRFEISALDSRLRECGTSRELIHCLSCAAPPHIHRTTVGTQT